MTAVNIQTLSSRLNFSSANLNDWTISLEIRREKSPKNHNTTPKENQI